MDGAERRREGRAVAQEMFAGTRGAISIKKQP